ncbi:hypothetical protein AHiyo4_01350 [Arthrobacter sp. Hiyo4]|nr:hypothetical protein AHiyo4_01350 [Arthrobacter sp. Hiyo4]
MHVGVYAAGSEDLAFARDDVGCNADGDVHAPGDLRISGLADFEYVPVAQCHIGFVDAGVVKHNHIGDHGVRNVLVAHQLPVLAHAVTDDLAATKHHLFTVVGVVVLNLEEQVSVSQADGVARGGAVEVRVLFAAQLETHLVSSCREIRPRLGSSGPLIRFRNP